MNRLRKVIVFSIILTGILFSLPQSGAFADSPPQAGTLAPINGESAVNEEVIFTSTFIDPDGYENLLYGLFRVYYGGTTPLYALYRVDQNRLYLYDYDTRSWTQGVAPGTAITLETNYAKLDCAKTTVQGEGDTLTVKWAVTFKEKGAGISYNMYLYARDLTGQASGWQYRGTWSIGGNSPPEAGDIIPCSGESEADEEVYFTTNYVDPDGWDKLYYGLFLINTEISSKNCFYGYYNLSSNKLYLYVTGLGWVGGHAPGSQNIIQNPYVSLDCSKTTVNGQGDTLSVTWAVTFKETFAGKSYNMYLYARDLGGLRTGWVQKGNWIVYITPFGKAAYWTLLDEHDTHLPNLPESGLPYWFFNAAGGDRGKIKEEDVAYSWDGDSSYEATIVHKDAGELWTFGGMWYSLIRVDNDDIPLNFQKIFGPYIKDEYQGRITEIQLTVNNVSSTTNNSALRLKFELKDENGNFVHDPWYFTDLLRSSYPRTFTIVVPEGVEDVEQVVWILDVAQVGDSISVDNILMKAEVPDTAALPSEEQAFYWTYSWLMGNYNPATGMFKDKSRDGPTEEGGDDMETITATAKAAKITYYAYRKGYIDYEEAVEVITKIADTMINVVPRGPVGTNTIWPHFTWNGGGEALPPHSDRFGNEFEGTEWATGDTAFAALDIITALQMIGDPQGQIPQITNFLEEIDWNDLLLAAGFLSHGYYYNGDKIPYDWRGFGMETIGINWAYASSTGNVTDMLEPPTDNGSGFIENAHYPMLLSGTDGWGNDWDLFRSQMADLQIDWYNSQNYNRYLSGAGLFGLSAGEVPYVDLHPDPDYIAYGTGGKSEPNDGDGVMLLHYSGMISDIRPVQAVNVWEALRDRDVDFLRGRVIISPINNLESIKVDKDTGRLTINHLKGSWNLSLQAEGWALQDPDLRQELYDAVQNNAFLKRGYDALKNPIDQPLRVPQDYPTIQAAIDAAVSGDRILVSPGTYEETITLYKSGIVLMGSGSGTVIRGNGSSHVVYCENITGEETVIEGFKITNGIYGIRCAGTVQTLLIRNNNLMQNMGETSGYGIYLESGSSVSIYGNSIYKCGKGIYGTGGNKVEIINNNISSCRGPYGGGIYLSGANATIENNSVTNCWDRAINLTGNSVANVIRNRLVGNASWNVAAGIDISNSSAWVWNNIIQNSHVYNSTSPGVGLNAYGSDVFLYNNIFYNNYGASSSARGAAFKVYDTNLDARNNIFMAHTNAKETIYAGGTGVRNFQYNDLWQNTTQYEATGIGIDSTSIKLNPSFVDVMDFVLEDNSPCINRGDPDPHFQDRDGSINDMGIYGGPRGS